MLNCLYCQTVCSSLMLQEKRLLGRLTNVFNKCNTISDNGSGLGCWSVNFPKTNSSIIFTDRLDGQKCENKT